MLLYVKNFYNGPEDFESEFQYEDGPQVLEFNDHAYNSVHSVYSILKTLSDPAREVRDKLNNPEYTGISKGDYRRFCQQLDRCNEDLNKLCTMIDEIIDDSVMIND